MRVYYTCKHCDAEMEVHVRINEDDDLPENCPQCDAIIPEQAHSDVNLDAIEKASDPDYDR